eukprot:5561533-Pleurochrysis_carterae.AAC.2
MFMLPHVVAIHMLERRSALGLAGVVYIQSPLRNHRHIAMGESVERTSLACGSKYSSFVAFRFPVGVPLRPRHMLGPRRYLAVKLRRRLTFQVI